MSIRSTTRQRAPPPPAPCQKSGYAAVANWISLNHDNEAFVFRKFDELAARNLLYLQSELLHLEGRIQELDEKDAASDDLDVKDAARTWEVLVERAEAGDEAAKTRMSLIAELRTKLDKYRELFSSSLLYLGKPATYM